ncbi:MAG: HAD-IC family P-type ATPase [Gammaproteobacteria bacterium]|nr:HAD-IC family P-type ATPase [Gammaproteobacteria bacterium]
MNEFDFPISGAHGDCCVGNVKYALEVENQPAFFNFAEINLSPDFKRLMVKVDDDVTTEEEVRRYIHQSFEDSGFTLVRETARKYWQKAALGLGTGIVLLMLSLIMSTLPLPAMIVIAIVGMGLTAVLGAGSFRKAKSEFKRREPGMDTFFIMSTSAVTVMSLLAFFVPGFPMMFEASLLIFGFRHLGIAMRKSIYEDTTESIRYQRLAENAAELLPGETRNIAAGETIPLNGWLVSTQTPSQDVWMDVSRIEGTSIPKKVAVDEGVLSGMVAKTDCVIQVGLGHSYAFYPQKPAQDMPRKGQLWVYPEGNQITIAACSDKTGQVTDFTLTKQNLTGSNGVYHGQDILKALRLGTVSHLEEKARQQLFRGIMQHASAQGLTKTASFLQQLEDDLQQSALTRAPIQDQTKAVLKYFVPFVLGTALVLGALSACFVPPIIAVRFVLSLLSLACPCGLGFITPLILDFSRDKGKKLGIIFNQADAIQRLTEIDMVALDIHGTSTKGMTAEIQISASEDACDIKKKLALLEQHSKHPFATAIYTAVQGDTILQDTDVLEHKIDPYQGGVGVQIGKTYYLLGNQTLMREHGIIPKQTTPGLTHFIALEEGVTRELATIAMTDPLREDTIETVRQLKKRDIKVVVISGADQKTAEAYAGEMGTKDKDQDKAIYAGCWAFDEEGKTSKATVIDNLKAQGHKVLMVGDGMNDASAIEAAHASIAMKHAFGDEGIQYKAKVRILNQKMMSIVDAIDIAHQSMWTIKLSLRLSLAYNLLAVMLTNILLVTCGMVLYPGISAALMVGQVGFIILIAYYFKQKPLPSAQLLERQGLYGGHARSPMSEDLGLSAMPPFLSF